MFLKPKSTHLEPRALLYRLYIDIVLTNSLKTCYNTIDGKYWQFDTEALNFYEIPYSNDFGKVIAVADSSVLSYRVPTENTKYYSYNNGWEEVAPSPSTSLALTFSNIGKYQTNKYYYVGSFSYIRKGTINDTVIQPIKGNITPLQTLNIQYYNDYINIKNGDLVVVNKHLYSVENVEEDHKHQPKDFAIYTAILNSII